MDEDRAKAFAGKLLDIYTGAVLTKLLDIGYQTGLLEAAASGPGTSREIGDRAGLQERYVREWLGAMATAGVCSYDPAAGTYAMPPEHAVFLSGASSRNLAPMSRLLDHLGKHVPGLVDCFENGGGIPYSQYRPEFTEVMDDLWRRIYDEQLVDGFLGAVDGVRTRLEAGARVLDIGCGTGHALNVMAREFPASEFVGYDIGEDAIAAGRAEADRMALSNTRFEVLDVSRLPQEPKFDLITAFDAIHDQRDPALVLRRVNEALAPDGVYLMIDFKFASDLQGNMGNPLAPMYYGISVMHCLTVSLAEGGDGLGTVWGVEKAREMLAQAGFANVDVVDSPRPQNCIFVCRK